MKNSLLYVTLLFLFIACQPAKTGDMNDFDEVRLEDLTTVNAPEGLVFVANTWRPDKGWELVPSKDGNKVMLMQVGGNKGSAGYECKCMEGAGPCGERKDIIMCIPETCTKCSTVLKVYKNHIMVDRANW
jgi:hypothetical protein